MSGLCELLTPLLLAFVAAILSAPFVIRVARRLNLLDRPQGHKAHAAPTPLLGGLIVAVAVFAAVAWFAPVLDGRALATLSALGTGSILILVIGLVDDLLGMSPGRKFLWQIAATAATGVGLTLLGVRLNLFLAWPPLPMIGLTVAWIVGITNAFNFLDNTNGLCAGLGAIAAISLSLLNWYSGETGVALVSMALAGACLGFLPYNWPSAHVFLGDAGSMFIGFMLASISVTGVYTRGAEVPGMAVFSPLVVLAVPILDMLLVVLLRVRARQAPWLGDRRHLNHRLVRRGLQPRSAVLVLWVAGAGCGGTAVSLPLLELATGLALIGILLLGLSLLAVYAGTEGLSRAATHPIA